MEEDSIISGGNSMCKGFVVGEIEKDCTDGI